jgi:signal transduction histidine kinase
MATEVLAEELELDKQPGVDPDRTRTLDLYYYHKNGSTKCLETIVSFLRDEDGNPFGIFGVSRDITERKKAERELKRINAELEGFAHTVSHDLKGPISTIMGANLVLQNVLRKSEEGEASRFEEDIYELLEIIDTGVNKAKTLIDEILTLAEAGQLPEVVSDVVVSEVVKTILEERAGDIQEKGITVHVDDSLGSVRANHTHIYQIFSNLIGNAIKHNDSENPVIEVSFLGDDEKGLHQYLVRDNGSGIAPDDLDTIFLPFARGETGETGIGLSTVEKIVGVYSGEIRAYNNRGACFRFTLKDY